MTTAHRVRRVRASAATPAHALGLACARASVLACVRASALACMRASALACMRASVLACVRASVLACVLAAGACARDAAPAAPAPPPLFEAVAPARSGVTFENDLPDDTTFNQLVYLYYYNGGGVAVGDYDGDGLPDLYFTSNLGGGRLYHNLGHFRFEDVSARAGVQRGAGDWTTGATFADVNGDGKPDLYVSGVDYQGKHGKNALYVNNGDGTFTDRTAEYGLEHVGYGTQALFFDFDGDGDLDAYLLNHSTHTEHGSSAGPQRDVPHPRAGDRLLRNDHGHFVDVTQRAHVYSGVEGYGLGVVSSDFDGDGCPDLFVTNDFQENDFLYRNRCGAAGFTESIASAMPHTSRFSMGVDAADFNNDGRPDVVVLDMLPDREEILRTSSSADDYVLNDMRIRAGYHPQFEHNTLELNRGGGKFSDVAFVAGVAATDWSWSPLFADLDNDGWKDLFITSGIYRRPNDLDYIQYVGSPAVQASLAGGITRENLTGVVGHMPSVPAPARAFRNDGDLTFTDVGAAWGLAQPGFGNGAAYVDLDNDGALDLVVNRVNAPAAIYRNRARSMNGRHFLTVTLRGEGKNTGGIGARVTAWTGAMEQLLEEQPTRGFESSIDPRLHFGLGAATRVDSLVVVWPDRRRQRLTNVAADQFLTVWQRDAKGRWSPPRPPAATTFADVTATTAPHVKHEEDSYSDFDRERLLPHLLSTEGPALAVADVNGDGLDDIYVGGAKWQPGRLLVQQRDGTFRPDTEPDFLADKIAEDVDAAFVDANGDGHPDLLVVSGGNEFTGRDDPLLPRLYVNDGRGHFHRDRAALPPLFDNGACVAVGDYDGDGHPDLFIGSRVVGGKYGPSPRSHLLRNDGHGRFVEVTDQIAPALADAGMVTSAAWVDYDGDGKLDLVVAGEWTPVRVFRQEGGRLVDRTAQAGLGGSEGWWSSVAVADVNGDGRPDLVLGNLGLNSYLRASAREPARLYVGDLFGAGTVALMTTYVHGTSYPVASRDELLKVAPRLAERFPTYRSYAAATIDSVVPRDALAKATVLEAHTFASAIALNRGGRFELRPLPLEAQLAPIYAAVAGDFDGDGTADLLVAGNLYGAPPLQGRYDATRGLLLHGRGDGSFEPVELDQSGVDIEGETRRMKPIRLADGSAGIVVARNDADLLVLRRRAPATKRSLVADRR